MKKILIILWSIFLWSIFLSCNTLANEFNFQKKYTIKNHTVDDVPHIMEFFSFFCPYCYEFQKMHNIKKLIRENITKKIKIETYHVDFLGGRLSSILTKSWIIAQQMGIEDKIIIPIFTGIQETHTIKNLSNIRKIFKKKAKISTKKFNQFWNSLTIEILVRKKNKDIKKSELNNVPSMLINGKYIIDYYKLESEFKNDFNKKYIKLIQFLINKK